MIKARQIYFAMMIAAICGATCATTRAQSTNRPAVTANSDSQSNSSVAQTAGESQEKQGEKEKSSSATQPVSGSQKFNYGLRRSILSPGSYLGAAVSAYITERHDVKAPGKTGEDKFADGLSRFARAFATGTNAELLSSGVFPILFKQNPVYQPSRRKGFMPRALYAASRTLITTSDNGKIQPNFSRILGDLTSASLANVYERHTVDRRDAFGRPIKFDRRNGFGPTMEGTGWLLASQALSYVVVEEFKVASWLRRKKKNP